MTLLKQFSELINPSKVAISPKARHIAITMDGIFKWAQSNEKSLVDAHRQANIAVKNTILAQVKYKVPIITFYALPAHIHTLEHFSIKVDALVSLFNDIKDFDVIHKNRMKVSVFGKWYGLPSRIVEPIKSVIDSTREYDNFFVNFCINYDGQEEIVDACKIIAMKVKTEKIDASSITKADIKDNLYTSDFLPPDLIIKNGIKQKLHGFLLWDADNAVIHFTGKLWPDFENHDLKEAIHLFEKEKI
jgi:undecaprenyl diphosphate synthase